MTKEKIFRNLQKGIALGFALPHEDGNLQNIHVVELEVLDGSDVLENWLPSSLLLWGTPAPGLHQRGKQLSRLFDEYSKKEILLAIVIKSAEVNEKVDRWQR